MSPLQAIDLGKRYGDTVALEALNLAVDAGDVVCLLGANGAGKTTTLQLLLGFLAPTSSEAPVDGRAVRDDPRAARARLVTCRKWCSCTRR